MVLTINHTGEAVIYVTASRLERDDLQKFFYNLKDGVAWDANMDVNQRARVANMFSPFYDVFDADYPN